MISPNRTVLVTGANRGIGREVAAILAATGHRVLLSGLDAAECDEAAESIRISGGDVTAVMLDVTDLAAVMSFVENSGAVDVLVNNAGIYNDLDQTPLTADFSRVRRALDVNLFGAWTLAQALAPAMREKGWGRIVNVSSQAGSFAAMAPNVPGYCVSKAALNAMTELLAQELRGTGMLVNAVCPGWTATEMGGPGGRPVADGARSVIWGVELPDDGPTGGFFHDGRLLAF